MKVIEFDMSYSYLIYFICVEMTAFHEFAAICCICLWVVTVWLVYWHMQEETIITDNKNGSKEAKNDKKRLALIIGKFANVALTVLAFFQILISDLGFDIAEDVEEALGSAPNKTIYPT